ncbi:hypothetical protein BEWA_009230 [Theileria equi strain WA]|uniref:Symplekin C-terminal domain-containing protein n=1 Tax=Theileria equi strain WA TaxID=1537102 RepID=L0B2R1_THEEQ|nr:hypothetical protein BEWA_009230 [Theileria equi strain WA]AFZ81511.1 hypothetical protein BEWA_009230 [Theileria equi strain WA]|eukprot:XP_004831177.1 hypothetical protein BEWA_009230 [Theileria equi strain WA]
MDVLNSNVPEKLQPSQEWYILNLLRLGQRDAFETNLQQFRKLQLSQSHHGKIRLCRLIYGIIKIDPQYAVVLIEDISHLLNDSSPEVQNASLSVLSKTICQFILIVLDNDADNKADSKSDLSCAIYLVNRILLTTNSDIDVEYSQAAGLVHSGQKSVWIDSLRVIMYLLVLGADKDSGKNGKIGDSLDPIFEKWIQESVNTLVACIKNTSTKAFTVRSIMAFEVSSILVSRFPDAYFEKLAPTMAKLVKHLDIYETLLLRIFTSKDAQEFHTELLSLLSPYGYPDTLDSIYKKSHAMAGYTFTDMKKNTYVDIASVLKIQDEDDLINYATSLETDADSAHLRNYKAAQIFECNSSMIRSMCDINNQDYTVEGLRLNLSDKLDPQFGLHDGVDDMEIIQTDQNATTEDANVSAVDIYNVVKSTEIANYAPLYINLVITQMMDTATSYVWHLKNNVIGGASGRFSHFRDALFNKLILSTTIPENMREKLFHKYINYIAHKTLVDQANPSNSHTLFNILSESSAVGVSELFAYVIKTRSLDALNALVHSISNIIIHLCNVEQAKEVLVGEKNEHKTVEVKLESLTNISLFVSAVLSSLYSREVMNGDMRDSYIQMICRFVLNLPYIPYCIVDTLKDWIGDSVSRILAFSLLSNLLKNAQSVGYVHLKSTILNERLFVLLLHCVTSANTAVRTLFLKLLSSPKGLYQPQEERRYSLQALEGVHDEIIAWISSGGGCSKCNSASLSTQVIQDVQKLASRPIWQWPQGIVTLINSDTLDCEGTHWNHFMGKMDTYLSLHYEVSTEWSLLSSVWIEEISGLLAGVQIKTHPFIRHIATMVTADKLEQDDTMQEQNTHVELLSILASRNAKLLHSLLAISTACTFAPEVSELVFVFRYASETATQVGLPAILETVRSTWWDPKHQLAPKWEESHELVATVLNTDYIVELAPFLSPEEMDGVIKRIFDNGDVAALKRMLDLVTTSPVNFKKEQKELKFALPQNFLYTCYAIPGSNLRRQTELLDYCIESCVAGRFRVESALSACTLIVEGDAEISSIFGRLLCQLVQKIPLTRGPIVQSVVPKLLSRKAWEDKMLWKGVMLSISILWPSYKEQICKLLPLIPKDHGKVVIQALQNQHNALAFIESHFVGALHIPEYIQEVLNKQNKED